MGSPIPTAGYASRLEAVAAMDRQGYDVSEIVERTGISRDQVIKLRSQARLGPNVTRGDAGALYTRGGAHALARRLKAYWRERGYQIEVEIIEGKYENRLRQASFSVRTNLVNGLPPESARIKREAAA